MVLQIRLGYPSGPNTQNPVLEHALHDAESKKEVQQPLPAHTLALLFFKLQVHG